MNICQRVVAEINLDNLAHNVRNIKKKAGASRLMAVVKADAYGHGAYETAVCCLENGADCLAVANIDEALGLRHMGIKAPILILGDTLPERFRDVAENDITQTIYSRERAEALSEESLRLGRISRVHIKTDTGMGRIGFFADETSVDEITGISRLKGISLEGIFTHFATADAADKNYTLLQAERFEYMCGALEKRGLKLMRHCSNSAAILDMLPRLGFDMVRAGIILYGCYPSDEVSRSIDIRPVMSVKSYISHIKTVLPGDSISYGRTFVAKSPMTIATIPVGYADGYMRSLSNKGRIIVNGSYAPIVGRICMDQFMADLSHIPDAKVGDEAVLMGEQGYLSVDADEIASLAGTISYEILCAVSKRVPRVYIKNN